MRLLVVEDEENLRTVIRKRLMKEGYSVDACGDGQEALDYMAVSPYDTVILDIMMPKMSGMEVLKKMRAGGDQTPVLFLTAKDGIEDRVKGLDSGADDYVTKPFNPVELLARVRSQLRRYMKLGGSKSVESDSLLRVGPFELDDKTKTLTLDGEPVSLTPTEYKIIQLLMSRPGEVLSPREIYRQVWKDEPYGADSTVAVHIRHLREKLEINPAEPRYLKVVWAQGYKLVGE